MLSHRIAKSQTGLLVAFVPATRIGVVDLKRLAIAARRSDAFTGGREQVIPTALAALAGLTAGE
jgi:hypothetical protein